MVCISLIYTLYNLYIAFDFIHVYVHVNVYVHVHGVMDLHPYPIWWQGPMKSPTSPTS